MKIVGGLIIFLAVIIGSIGCVGAWVTLKPVDLWGVNQDTEWLIFIVSFGGIILSTLTCVGFGVLLSGMEDFMETVMKHLSTANHNNAIEKNTEREQNG